MPILPSHEPPRHRTFASSARANSWQFARVTGRAATAGGSSLTEIIMDLLTWLIVGLIAGLLASAVVGGIGYGLIGDIVVGMVGAVVGGWIFSALRIGLPISGLPGTIAVAFIGSVVLLLLIRLLRPGRRLA